MGQQLEQYITKIQKSLKLLKVTGYIACTKVWILDNEDASINVNEMETSNALQIGTNLKCHCFLLDTNFCIFSPGKFIVILLTWHTNM